MWWREASPRSFYKKSKLDISLDRKKNSLEFYTVCFYCMSKSRSTEIY